MPSPTAKSRLPILRNPPPIPPRPNDGHKGLFGRVLIVGGNAEMIGAPIFGGAAALRTGSGLVQVAMPDEVLATALSVVPELIGLALENTGANLRKLSEAADHADVVVVGPGMGKGKSVSDRIKLLIGMDKPMVIDADALNYLASLKSWPKSFAARAVLTPHPGEMKRLSKFLGNPPIPADDKGRIELAVSAAKRFRQIIVLKGHRTVVTDAHQVYINHTGDSSLSKAGAGDVLSGIIASLIGQKMALFAAACAGVHLHGLAGELAGKKLGKASVLARDVIDAINSAIAMKAKSDRDEKRSTSQAFAGG